MRVPQVSAGLKVLAMRTEAHERQPLHGFTPLLEPGEFCIDIAGILHTRAPDGCAFAVDPKSKENRCVISTIKGRITLRPKSPEFAGCSTGGAVPNNYTIVDGEWCPRDTSY